AVNLHEMCPGLRIVGIVTTPINIKGEELTRADEEDNLLVEQINATSADLLLLALDEEIQQIWIERVRHKLKTPLILCVGSALEELSPARKPSASATAERAKN